MANLQQGVPQLNSIMVDMNGIVTQPWYRFFISLFNRTGGGTGTDFAPADSSYIVTSPEPGLTNAVVATNSSTTLFDFSTPGEVKVDVIISAIVIPESQVSGLLTSLAQRALISTRIIAGTGLSGGGDLSANSTLNIDPVGATAALNPFSSSLKGLVPASGGGTTNYLRSDATFDNPLSGGVSGTISLAKLTTGGTNGSLTVVNGLITLITNPT